MSIAVGDGEVGARAVRGSVSVRVHQRSRKYALGSVGAEAERKGQMDSKSARQENALLANVTRATELREGKQKKHSRREGRARQRSGAAV